MAHCVQDNRDECVLLSRDVIAKVPHTPQMSRLIVKGLPKYLTEDRLKEHFAKEGSVTDVKLMKKRNGESRQFAFIGYKSSLDAERAVKYFNRTFIDTARIEVIVAKTFSDPTVPKAVREKRKMMEYNLAEQESRLVRQKEELEQRKRQKSDKRSKLDQEIEANPKLKEFIETLKPSAQQQSWNNDALADGSGAPSTKALEEALAKSDGAAASPDLNVPVAQTVAAESDDEYEDFGKQEESDDEPMMPLSGNTAREDSVQETREDASEKEVESEESTEQNQENIEMSDLDWLKLRRRRMKENEDEAPEVAEPARETKPVRPVVTYLSPEEETEQKLRQTGRLFIRNILYDSTEDEFRELFSQYGPLEEVHIAIDTRTSKSKGFVYVQFENPEDAVRAFRAMDKQIFQGRLLHILAGEAKKDHKLDEFALKNLPLKKQRELKKKAQANKSQFNWNSLYMNSDAVLDSVAAKLGVTKSQLIDPENSSSAVKQALAEAHVIGDVRKFFEERGIDLTAFNTKERDDKVILVKNFPFGTTSHELGDLFAEHGQIKRIVMPPSGTIAIIEFRDAPGARAAFTKLAYRMFKKSILYLEKGPKDLFTQEPTAADSILVSKPDEAVDAKITANDILADDAAESDDEIAAKGPTVSVFVKNLNFSTTSAQLSDFFRSVPGFVVGLVKTKPDPKTDGVLSMGFGFVEFQTKENAELAIRTLNNAVLDGHRVQLKLSHRKSDGSAPGSSAKKSLKSNKIIIKNLPFEASRKDVLELFGAYGQIKSVRVPKKYDKSARGFAFVEYTLLKEAESAMDQLKGVHLLGRRLVMQFAEKDSENAEEEIERMTQKVKKQAASREVAAVRLAGQQKMQLEDAENPFDEF